MSDAGLKSEHATRHGQVALDAQSEYLVGITSGFEGQKTHFYLDTVFLVHTNRALRRRRTDHLPLALKIHLQVWTVCGRGSWTPFKQIHYPFLLI